MLVTFAFSQLPARRYVFLEVNAFAQTLDSSAISSIVFSMMAVEQSTTPCAANIVLARRGDPNAFAALVRSAQRPIYGLCIRLLRSEAEAAEVAQDAFLRAYQNLHRYDETKPFDIWVMAIARNLCLDILRRRSKVKTEDLSDVQDGLPAREQPLEERMIEREEHQSLEAAIATLPCEDREILALYYVQKRTTKDIASVMNVAPGTIMARLFRAREKLRKQLKQRELS